MNGPKTGDRVKVRWPGSDHDFVLEYYDDAPGTQPRPSPGWGYIRGVQVEPEGLGWRQMRTFQARQIGEREYELMPVPR